MRIDDDGSNLGINIIRSGIKMLISHSIYITF